MKTSTILFLLFAVVACVIAAGTDEKVQDIPIQPPGPVFPPQPPSNVTTPKPEPTTSKTTTTSTTQKPTTSTTPASTTTTKPTTPTTTTTTTTTTPAPTTTTKATTTAAPTPSPKPTPTPKPAAGEWIVNYTNTNQTCLVVKMAIQLEIVESANTSIVINVPSNASFQGNCDTLENLTLLLPSTVGNLRFVFGKASNKFSLENVTAGVNMTGVNATKWVTFVHNKTEFATPLDNSYKCNKEQSFVLNSTDVPTMWARLYVSDVQFQAFRNSTDSKFSSAMDCEASSSPDVVPIAVGCVLVGLIIMVLVAYLFGRRRCQARGYLSMFQENKREEDYIPMKNLSCFN